MRRILQASILLAAAVASAGDWPQFRGPSGSGVGDGAKPPVRWDAVKGTNVVWKTEIPGLSVSSPVVWGDRVFIATAISGDAKQKIRVGLYGDTDPVTDNSPHEWKLLGLDKKTGKILWERRGGRG